MKNVSNYVVRHVLNLDRRLDEKFKGNIISEFDILYHDYHKSEAESYGKIVFLSFGKISELEKFKETEKINLYS